LEIALMAMALPSVALLSFGRSLDAGGSLAFVTLPGAVGGVKIEPDPGPPNRRFR